MLLPGLRIRINLMRILIRLFTSLRIRVLRNCDYRSTDPSRLNFERPRLHCERQRPSTDPFWAPKAPEIFTLKCIRIRTQILTQLRIRIKLPKIMRIGTNRIRISSCFSHSAFCYLPVTVASPKSYQFTLVYRWNMPFSTCYMKKRTCVAIATTRKVRSYQVMALNYQGIVFLICSTRLDFGGTNYYMSFINTWLFLFFTLPIPYEEIISWICQLL